MEAAEINGKFPINKDPQVIVTGKGELFPSSVNEASFELGGKMEVFRIPVSKTFPVDRKEI